MLAATKSVMGGAPFAVGSLRILIADSQELHLRRLKLSLSCLPQVDSILQASTPAEFRRLARQQQPNLVIADICLGSDASTFDILADLASRGLSVEVIFLTATKDGALKAFEIGAADYLLKPVSFERLSDAVQRAGLRVWMKSATSHFAHLQQRIDQLEIGAEGTKPAFADHLWFKNGSELAQIAVDDVESFQAAGDYVIAHTPTQSHMLGYSISALEARLDPDVVIRVHRSSLINVTRIRSIRRRKPRGLALVLSSGKQVAVGPKFEAALLSSMNAPRWR